MLFSRFINFCKKNARVSIAFALGIVVGALGWHYQRQITRPGRLAQRTENVWNQIYPLRTKSEDNVFTAPLLGYELPESIGLPEYKPLEEKIGSLIQEKIKQGNATNIATYFRDHNRGRWVGVNENDQFSPASLLKVPLMMVYYKIAQTDPSRLQNKLTYQGGENLNAIERIRPSQELTLGTSYTVDDLINRMIIHSDNNATQLLLGNLDRNTLRDLFSDLGIQLPENGQPSDYLSAKSYSLFFRLLYNATYLNEEFSEHALSLLAQTEFKEGLAAGVPGDIPVAHKFGEYEGDTGAELHDCGDIYFSENPYLLCIMTKGNNLDSLKNIIKDISNLVYDEMRHQYANK